LKALFDFAKKLDNTAETYKDSILEEAGNPDHERSYTKLVKYKEGDDFEYIKIKLNSFMRENDKNEKQQMVKVFYKYDPNYTGKYKFNRWKNVKIAEIGRVLRAGVKVRFILHVNKLWYNQDMYGLSIKSL